MSREATKWQDGRDVWWQVSEFIPFIIDINCLFFFFSSDRTVDIAQHFLLQFSKWLTQPFLSPYFIVPTTGLLLNQMSSRM